MALRVTCPAPGQIAPSPPSDQPPDPKTCPHNRSHNRSHKDIAWNFIAYEKTNLPLPARLP
ncbi:MAG: hypothetical protein QGI77_14940, partial [Roseibacillus sp.]|nr:hypothetical protein [Roseibacillus sp.]